ncbi:MAG: CARDB domain-containing protein, partial [Chitinophagales bacterium]
MNNYLPKLKKSFWMFVAVLLFAWQTQAQYCDINFGFGTEEGDYLDRFVLEDIDNLTGPGTEYNDYTDISTVLDPALEYTITIYNNPIYPEFYAVWIDYNQNEEFEEDENLISSGTENYLLILEGTSGDITFTVPVTALPGETRLRVACAYFPTTPMEACFDYDAGDYGYYFGEVEDYTIVIPASGPYDLALNDIIGFDSDCGLSTDDITVELYNVGSDAANGFSISYQITDPVSGVLPVVTEDYIGADIGSFDAIEYTFSTPADFSNYGDYLIYVWITWDLDEFELNDANDGALTSIPIITTFPYLEDFEDGASGWTSGGTTSTWELGYPDGPVISGAPPATPTSENSWATGLYDYYSISENSYVVGPCFDFSTLEVPYVKFDIWWATPGFYDGARLEYSLDDGTTWQFIGVVGTGDNWYTSGGCYAFGYDPVTSEYFPAWEGSSSGWKTANHDLDFLAGEPQVLLRIHFKTSTWFSGYDGIAFDNFFVGDPYPHDIGIIALIEPGSGPSLSAAEAVTVTIENFGLNAESGFPVSYQMDGGTIHTETFVGSIASGAEANFTFTSTEDLTADGDYTFVAWTALGTDGDFSNDNLDMVVSNLFPIIGTDAYYIYSNAYGGAEPWYTTTNSEAMDAVYGAGAWNQDFFETVDIAATFSSATCFVWLEGGEYMADELENFLNTNTIAIQNWVASGGHLFLNSAPDEGDGMSFLFGGVNLEYYWYTNTAIEADPSHPIFEGPYTPVGDSWTGFSFGHAAISGGDVYTLIVDQYALDKVGLAEKNWGDGVVMFGGMTPTYFHSPVTEATNLRWNIISYLGICTLSDTDVGVQSITAPSTGCGMDDEAVTVKVRNFGYEPQTDIPVNYSLDGGTTVTETVAGTLAPGETILYTFTTLADLSVEGSYSIFVWTSLDGDTIISNDSSDITITNIPIISSYPYYQDFEAGDGGWTHGGASSTWELGSPADDIIDGPPPTTPSSVNSWMTNLDGDYNNNEKSYVLGPCFDFEPLTLPYVQLDIWWETDYYFDGAELQYSLNGGVAWNVVGTIGSGDNWYTNYGISFGYDPSWPLGYPEGWVGSGGDWKTAYHDISFLAGEPQVQFRVFFSSDASVNYYNGVAFDNFKIADPFPNDISVVSLVEPAITSASFTSSETVTVKVKNFGTNSQTGFTVKYLADGGTTYSGTYAGTITAGATGDFTFAAAADLSAFGTHSFTAWTELAGDINLSNDTLNQDVFHMAPVTGGAAYLVYSNSTGSEPFYGTEYSDAMDDVFGADWTLDYYEAMDPFEVFNPATCFIYMQGGADHSSEMQAFLDDNQSLVEAWVE